MNIPAEVVKALTEKNVKINPSILMHGKAKLTVEFQKMDFAKDLSSATPIFVVTNVEKPASKPRKPKEAAKPAKK